jgi:hypothetical protein
VLGTWHSSKPVPSMVGCFVPWCTELIELQGLVVLLPVRNTGATCM